MATMEHVRAEGLCASGVRAWFGRYDHEFIRRFCRGEVSADELEATGDAFALRVAARARLGANNIEDAHGR